MTSDWRDTRAPITHEKTEMLAVRVSSDMKHRVQAIVNGGNSTLAAAVRWGLEKFIEENTPPSTTPGKLFD